jgi:cell division protease FtsH
MAFSPTAPLTPKQSRNYISLGLIVLSALIFFLFLNSSKPTPTPINFSTALSEIHQSKVKVVNIDSNTSTILLQLKNNGIVQQAGFPLGYENTLTQLLVNKNITISSTVLPTPSLATDFIGLIPTLAIIGILAYFLRKTSRIGGFSKGQGEVAAIPNIRFSDVAGSKEAIEELKELVDYLHDPSRYNRLNAHPSKGYLLTGPPGTGKTLLARAVAGEARVPFFSVNGSDFTQIFVGAGSSRVQKLFERAKKAGKAIIFIDEIDGIGRRRSNSTGISSNEYENTLNKLMTEIDGFEKNGIVVIGATNRPETLDPALMRPGRFTRTISVPLPDIGARREIFNLYLEKHPHVPGIDIEHFVKRMIGMSGSAIAEFVNEAALEAARSGSPAIREEDLEEALHIVTIGKARKSAVLSELDKKITAYHEAAHATVSYFSQNAQKPLYISIVPRGYAGGFTGFDGSDDTYMSYKTLKAHIAVAMAGRAGEMKLLNGDYTQGAHGDLTAATNLATNMITNFGMIPNALAVINDTSALVSPLAATINDQVNKILDGALQEAIVSLDQHEEFFEKVALELLDKEVLALEDLDRIQAGLTPSQ